MRNTVQIILAILLVSTISQAQKTIQVGATTLTERDVVTGLDIPWDLVWGPDDHIWFTERAGKVKKVDPNSGNTTTILDISNMVINGGGEPGLLGMMFHPEWETTAKIYIVYTYGSFNDLYD